MRHARHIMGAGLGLGIGLWPALSGSGRDASGPKEPEVGRFSGVTVVKRPGSASAPDSG